MGTITQDRHSTAATKYLQIFVDGPYLYTIRQFADRIERDRSVAVRILRDLHMYGYVMRGNVPKEDSNYVSSLYYYGLSAKGMKVWTNENKRKAFANSSSEHSFRIDVSKSHVRHELGITESYLKYRQALNMKADAELTDKGFPVIRNMQFDFNGVLNPLTDIMLRPDMLISVEQYDQKLRSYKRRQYCIEVDTGTMRRAMLSDKISRYCASFDETVCFFTFNEDRRNEIERLCRTIQEAEHHFALYNPDLRFLSRAMVVA